MKLYRNYYALECLTYDDGWVSTWLDDEDADDDDDFNDGYDLQLLLNGSLNSHVHILLWVKIHDSSGTLSQSGIAFDM